MREGERKRTEEEGVCRVDEEVEGVKREREGGRERDGMMEVESG